MRQRTYANLLTIALIISISPAISDGLPRSGDFISPEMVDTLDNALHMPPPQRMIEVDIVLPESIRNNLKAIFQKLYRKQH